MNRNECGLISDACVSMRVCFDSLCFSSTQQRLADEEDASQLQTNVSLTSGSNAGTTTATIAEGIGVQIGTNQVPTRAPAMDTLRDLQELLRVKDERIAELETLLCRRDSEIQDLRSHLDKFLSVLPFKSPLTPTKPRPRKQRAQGISAEPPLQQLAPLVFYDKSDNEVATQGQFKHLVEIIVKDCGNTGICGGAVLDETRVLTAAHCVSGFDKKDLLIIAGTNDLHSAYAIRRQIDKIHIHEEYKDWKRIGTFEYYKIKFLDWLMMEPTRPPLQNDIAVLRLQKALPLGEYISSVELPMSPVLPYYEAIPFASWGNIAANTSTNILRWTNFEIEDDYDCYDRTGLDSRHQFCIMDPRENSCVLQGDSGAPLVYNRIVIGVTSYGYRSPDHPTMFTKVFDYVGFIQKIMKNDN